MSSRVLPLPEWRDRLRRLHADHPIDDFDAELVWLDPPDPAEVVGGFPRLRLTVLGDDPPWWATVLPVEYWAYLNFALLHGGAVLTLRAVPDDVLPRLARACDAALMPLEPGEAGSGGDHLPPGARPLAIAVPSGSRGEGHLETPRDAAFSADGRLAATAAGGLVKLWEVGSGDCLATVPVDADRVRFAPGGRAVLATDRHGGALLDSTTGQVLAVLPSPGAWFSPDGRWLGVLDHGADPDSETDDMVRVFDATTGVEAYAFPGGWASFNPDGTALAVEDPITVTVEEAGDPGPGTSTVFALSDGRLRLRVPGRATVFAPDREAILTVVGSDVVVWDADTGARTRTLSAPRRLSSQHRAGVGPVAVPGVDALVAARQDAGSYAAWDIPSGRRFTGSRGGGPLGGRTGAGAVGRRPGPGGRARHPDRAGTLPAARRRGVGRPGRAEAGHHPPRLRADRGRANHPVAAHDHRGGRHRCPAVRRSGHRPAVRGRR
jgi:hypothetical protein